MPGRTTGPDPHSAPVPESAWAADEEARARGRVQMFNATRPGGLDGWTMDLGQYELMRGHILDTLRDEAGPDGTLPLQVLVTAAQDRYGAHPAFPRGRLRNYCTYTKVDLEARGLVERVAGRGAQRLRLTTAGERAADERADGEQADGEQAGGEQAGGGRADPPPAG